jgi:hypothetical protein
MCGTGRPVGKDAYGVRNDCNCDHTGEKPRRPAQLPNQEVADYDLSIYGQA